MKLFLDDDRNPAMVYYNDCWVECEGKTRQDIDNEWHVVKNYDEAVKFLTENKVDVISLDHDLGYGKTGYDLAKWMTENKKWPETVYFHSANPIGVRNMYNEWQFYLKTINERE